MRATALFLIFFATLFLPAAAALLRVAGGRPPRGGALPALVASLGVASLLALGAALLGIFSLGLLTAVNAAAAMTLVLADRTKDGPPGRSGRPGWPSGATWTAVAVAALAALLYFRPHEYFFGGWDPGVYVNTGVSLARTGALAVQDRTLPSIPPAEQELFYHRRHGMPQKYPGFVVRDAATGKVQPYFYYLFPTWIAIFVSGLGIEGGLLAGPFFVLLTLAPLFALARLLFGGLAACCTVGLFALSMPVIWQARMPTSEPVALFFLVAGWSLLARYARDGKDRLAWIAALAFGCALLVKLTALMPVVLTLVLYRFWAVGARAPGPRLVPALLGGTLVLVAPYYLITCRESTLKVYSVEGSTWGGVLLLVAAGAGIPLLLWAAPAITGLIRRHARLARRGAAALALALAIFGYWIRPQVERSANAANLVELGWFVTPLLLLLALCGVLALLLRRQQEEDPLPLLFLAVLSVAAGALLVRKEVIPFYPWALRRYLTEVLPALAFFSGAAVAALVRPGRALRVRQAAAVLLTAATVGWGMARGGHLLRHRDYEGVLASVREVASLVPADALTVCVDPWLATPLQYIFGRETLQVSDLTPEKSKRLEAQLARWAAERRKLYLLAAGGNFFSAAVSLVPAGAVDFRFPLLELSQRQYPRTIRQVEAQVRLFRVLPAGAAGAHRPDRVEIASAPLGLLEGFHGPERVREEEGSAGFRWTEGRAGVELPDPPRPDQAWELELVVGSGRPPGSGELPVRVLIDDLPVGETTIGTGLETRRVPVPAGFLRTPGQGSFRLTLETGTFRPADGGTSGDKRNLGLMWSSVAVRQRGNSDRGAP